MTWREFKQAVEQHGVTEETMLVYIDWLGYDPVKVVFREPDTI